MPSHEKVWCGMRFGLVPATSFCVRNHRDPAARAICGSAAGVAERVGQPHLHAARCRTPRRKNRLPATNCRASASPPGMFVSDSTHMPPTGTNCPRPTRVADPLEQLRVVLLHPGVLLRRGAGEHEARGRASISVEHVRERARALADGLAQRPQPGRVDVRVADGDDAVRAGVRRRRRARGASDRAAGGRRAGDVVGIHRVDDRARARAGSRPAAAGPRASSSISPRASRGPAAAPRPSTSRSATSTRRNR